MSVDLMLKLKSAQSKTFYKKKGFIISIYIEFDD